MQVLQVLCLTPQVSKEKIEAALPAEHKARCDVPPAVSSHPWWGSPRFKVGNELSKPSSGNRIELGSSDRWHVSGSFLKCFRSRLNKLQYSFTFEMNEDRSTNNMI